MDHGHCGAACSVASLQGQVKPNLMSRFRKARDIDFDFLWASLKRSCVMPSEVVERADVAEAVSETPEARVERYSTSWLWIAVILAVPIAFIVAVYLGLGQLEKMFPIIK